MSHQWLAAENFERSHELISAINALVIQAQLAQSGKPVATRREDVEQARTRLLLFLQQLAPIVHSIERDEDAPVLGADPRLAALARDFLAARRQSLASALGEVEMERATRLLQPSQLERAPRAERKQVIEFLRALRSLLENNSRADIVGLLGAL